MLSELKLRLKQAIYGHFQFKRLIIIFQSINYDSITWKTKFHIIFGTFLIRKNMVK